MKNTFKNWLRKAGLVGLVVGGLAVGKARGATTFSQIIQGDYKDGADVTLTNPNYPDTVMAKTNSHGYWARAPPDAWGLQLGDTVKIKVKDINGDSALTWRDITNLTGGNPIWSLYCGSNNALSVKQIIENGADSANVKCYKKGGIEDTLNGKFRINYSVGGTAYEIHFDGSQLNLQNGDTVVFEARAPGKSGKTEGTIQHKFIDADTFPSFELDNLDLGLKQIGLPDTATKDSIIIPKLIAENYSNLNETPKFYFEIGEFYKDSLQAEIKANSIDTLAFKPCTLNVSAGSYATKAFLLYNYDINQVNDTLKNSMYVKPKVGIEEVIEQPIKNKFSNVVKGYADFGDKTKGYLYDATGRKVKEIKGKTDVRNLGSGVYFFFREDNQILSKPEKLIILK